VIHKVFDITLSEIVGKENSTALISIDDLKASLPQNLVVVLEKNNADLPTWEAVQFVYENKKWGEFVVIASEADEDARQGKYVRILGENLFKVESFRREEAF
jgi:phage regulator Rha-like protein